MKEATQIVQILNEKGFVAYFAGGWVRDFLLNHPSDDIDIATNALPEDIEKIFSYTIPIGKAFGIILVILNNKQYEVATFRQDICYEDGRRPSKIKFSSAENDAKRRDFTINGMFYDPINKKIMDFVEGQKDLEKKIIKCIGDPSARFTEDRLRMIRAIRMSARFDFEIEKNTKKAILDNHNKLFPSVAIERVYQEFYKMYQYKGFKKALELLFDFNLLQIIFIDLKNVKKDDFLKSIAFVDDFPKNVPVIISLLELFPKYCLEEKVNICKYLKLSNKEIEFVVFYHNALKLLKKASIYDWVCFYANNFSYIALPVLAIHTPFQHRHDFLLEHEKKQKALSFYIQKMKSLNPIVTSSHLKAHNIKPGIFMGKLLKEAEKIAIEQKLKEPEKVIEKLKNTALWPKN